MNKTIKLRVFIDDSPLNSGHVVRGVGSYTINLIAALKETKSVRLISNVENADLAHYPYFDLFFLTLPLQKLKPTVVTMHDVIPLIYPNQYPKGIRGWIKFQIQKFSLKSAAAVITDSETSKKDIIRFLDVPQEKIHVIHLAPGKEFKRMAYGVWRREIMERYNLSENFVLYVGDVNYNKNIPNLLKAFSLVTNHQPPTTNIKLVLVGDAFKNRDLPETQHLFRLIEDLKIKNDVVMPGFVENEDLVKIYNLATIYCQPSLYEGFGLPVLEAMKCSCPVVAGKTQALVEIAEGAALFVNPKDPNSISDGLLIALNNQMRRSKLIKQGFAHVKKFSWEKTAQATIDVYKKIAHG